MKLNTKSNKGFTIIEVLIVLAIAGLILSVVFLALPSLQRNQRNAARRSDASRILSAVTEWTSNNNSAFPATCTAGSTGCNAAGTWLKNASMSQISADAVALTNATAAPASPPTYTTLDGAQVFNFVKCSGNNATTTNASARSFVVLFAIETPSSATQQCIEG